MAEPQIVFENIVKRFEDTVAVDTMNLSINQGEFLAIMGSSGCGKTTTLRMLAGLETPSQAAGVVLLTASALACLGPATEAARSSPLGILRHD